MAAKRLQELVLERTAGELRRTLRLQYASLEAVVQLCCRQLERGALSVQVLQAELNETARGTPIDEAWIAGRARSLGEELSAAEYVADCELTAQFGSPTSDDQQRRGIIEFYRAEYLRWARACMLARLTQCLGRNGAYHAIDAAMDALEDAVFGFDAFACCVREYDPRQGKRFANFLKRQIGWRICDIARALRSGPHVPRFHGGESLQIVAERVKTTVHDGAETEYPSVVLQCIDGYLAQAENHDLAERQVAAFQLRCRAYWDPSDISEAIRRRLADHWPQIEQEYLECRERLRQLEEEELPRLLQESETAQSRVDHCHHSLRRKGLTYARIGDLEQQALGENKTDLEKQLCNLTMKDRGDVEGLELQYMVHFKSLSLARGRWERKMQEYLRWTHRQKPWVRSEKEIGQMLGISQPRVACDLKRVRAFLDACVRRKSGRE